jgi:hypothetical protein
MRKRNYERYLALARAEAQSGNTVAAENYYQHAELFQNHVNERREIVVFIRCEPLVTCALTA